MKKKLILQEFEVRALVSVYNKEGISDFIKKIQDELDLEVIATGGTFQHLKKKLTQFQHSLQIKNLKFLN